MDKRLILSSLLFSSLNYAAVFDANTDKLIKFDPECSDVMLNENTTNINQKQLYLLKARQSGAIKENSLYLGGRFIGLMNYQSTNIDSKFGWLMRHPTANNQIGTFASEAVVHSVQTEIIGSILPWLTYYSNILYDPEQSFGAGTITSLGRNQVQLRKAYAIFGDLNQSPFFFTLGKFQSPFGLMDTVNPFTSSTVWHAFSGLSYGAKLEFYKNNFNLSAELAQGGSQFRAMQTSVEKTNVPSRLNNFVLDANYTKVVDKNTSVLVGGSYLKGSNYCQSFPITHFATCNSDNPAFDVYAQIKWDRLTLQGEIAKTLKVWPGTFNPQPPLNNFAASKVTSFDVGVKYAVPIYGRDYILSGSFSNFIAGPKGAPWHKQDQSVFGVATKFKTVKIYAEYIRVDGYAPLNFVSGSLPNDPFPAGTTHSQSNVHTDVVMIGVTAVI